MTKDKIDFLRKFYAEQHLYTYRWPYFYVRSKISNYLRFKRNQKIAKRYGKRISIPYPDHGYRIISPAPKINGLCRAYGYEIARLKELGLLNPSSRNIIIFGQPRHYWKILRNPPADFAETYRIGLWVTEFEVMPPDWDFARDLINEVWTPSEFSARALVKTGLPLKIVPHAVKVNKVPPLSRLSFGIPENAFVGMAIMDLGTCPDRKNPLAHIKVWKLAFQNDPNAVLIMKVRYGKRTSYVKPKLLNEIGNNKNIRLVEAEYDDEMMSAFQRMADVYLSLHRSEGYGLNIHEMLELGIPTIATGYSGNMTYQSKYPQGIAAAYKLTPYYDCTFHYEGANLQWADVELSSVVKLLKQRRDYMK